MNKVILIGRLVKDPELRRTNTDIPVVQFTLAVNRNFAGKGQERQADFISCVAWRNLAENLARFMKKGSQIAVEGQLQVRNFEDAGGVRRYVTEVICDNIHFLEPKNASNQAGGYNDYSSYETSYMQQPQREPQPQQPSPSSFYQEPKKPQQNQYDEVKKQFDISDDDLPF